MPGGTYDLLVVDDHAGIRYLIREMFLDEGYRVDLAANGKEALKKVAVGNYLLILLDFKMPGINGLDTLEKLHSIAPGTPVVMMTAHDEMQIVAEAKKRGTQHCLIKPFELDQVRSVVKGLLSKG